MDASEYQKLLSKCRTKTYYKVRGMVSENVDDHLKSQISDQKKEVVELLNTPKYNPKLRTDTQNFSPYYEKLLKPLEIPGLKKSSASSGAASSGGTAKKGGKVAKTKNPQKLWGQAKTAAGVSPVMAKRSGSRLNYKPYLKDVKKSTVASSLAARRRANISSSLSPGVGMALCPPITGSFRLLEPRLKPLPVRAPPGGGSTRVGPAANSSNAGVRAAGMPAANGGEAGNRLSGGYAGTASGGGSGGRKGTFPAGMVPFLGIMQKEDEKSGSGGGTSTTVGAGARRTLTQEMPVHSAGQVSSLKGALPPGITNTDMLELLDKASKFFNTRFFQGQAMPSHPWLLEAVKVTVPLARRFSRDIGLARITLAARFESYCPTDDKIQECSTLRTDSFTKLEHLEEMTTSYLNTWREYFLNRPTMLYQTKLFTQATNFQDALKQIDKNVTTHMTTFLSDVVKGYATISDTVREVTDFISLQNKQNFYIR